MIATNDEAVGEVNEKPRTGLRVANLVSSAFYGGPERIMVGLAKVLPPDCVSSFFVFGERGRGQANRGTEMLEVSRREGFSAVEIMHDLPNLPAMAREIASRLRETRANLLCAHGYKADVIGLAAARLAGIPCIGVAHNWFAYTTKLALYMELDWMALRRMDETIAVCDAQRERLVSRGVRPERITTIHNAIDAPATVPSGIGARREVLKSFTKAPRLIVGTAARLSDEKGLDVLVRAAEIVHRQIPDVGFAIFGDGPKRSELEKMIAARGLTDVVVLAGFRPEVHALFPGFDVMVLPSRTEGLPVVVLEAMAIGLPVVSTRVGGIPEAVVDGETGLLCASEDVVALAARLLKVLESDSLRATMGACGRERVLAKFNFSLQARKYVEVYDRVARHTSSSI